MGVLVESLTAIGAPRNPGGWSLPFGSVAWPDEFDGAMKLDRYASAGNIAGRIGAI